MSEMILIETKTYRIRNVLYAFYSSAHCICCNVSKDKKIIVKSVIIFVFQAMTFQPCKSKFVPWEGLFHGKCLPDLGRDCLKEIDWLWMVCMSSFHWLSRCTIAPSFMWLHLFSPYLFDLTWAQLKPRPPSPGTAHLIAELLNNRASSLYKQVNWPP